MKVQAKTKLKQLKTGVHLVVITDAVLIKDHENMPFITPAGETGLTVRFSDGANNHFDQDYWLNGDRQHFFDKMAATANIDTSNPQFKAEAKGKRLWICIKEVHEIDGDQPVTDITGPVINYYMFDTIPCLDPNKKPVVKGDPAENDGMPSGAFLDYKQVPKFEDYDKSYGTVHKLEIPQELVVFEKTKDPFDDEPKVEKVDLRPPFPEVDPWDDY